MIGDRYGINPRWSFRSVCAGISVYVVYDNRIMTVYTKEEDAGVILWHHVMFDYFAEMLEQPFLPVWRRISGGDSGTIISNLKGLKVRIIWIWRLFTDEEKSANNQSFFTNVYFFMPFCDHYHLIVVMAVLFHYVRLLRPVFLHKCSAYRGCPAPETGSGISSRNFRYSEVPVPFEMKRDGYMLMMARAVRPMRCIITRSGTLIVYHQIWCQHISTSQRYLGKYRILIRPPLNLHDHFLHSLPQSSAFHQQFQFICLLWSLFTFSHEERDDRRVPAALLQRVWWDAQLHL